MNRRGHILFVPNTGLRHQSGNYHLPRPDLDFLARLARLGFSCSVLGFSTRTDDPFSDRALGEVPGLRVRPLATMPASTGRAGKLLRYLKAALTSISILLRDRGFVYIYFPGHISTVVAVLCMALGRPYALYVRGTWKKQGFFGWLARRIQRKARFIFTTGQGFANHLQSLNKQAKPVYPMTTFRPDLTQPSGLDEEQFGRALFVGHILEEKGVLDAVRAIDVARERGLPLRLDIVGGGPAEEIAKLEALVRELGLGEQVHYHGHAVAPEVLEGHFRNADVFLFPSYYREGYPRVVYEAMTFGLPIVCTILPGMQGFNEDSRNCLEVPSCSPAAIADQLLTLRREPGLRRRLAEQARSLVEEYFAGFSLRGHADQFHQQWLANARLESAGTPHFTREPAEQLSLQGVGV